MNVHPTQPDAETLESSVTSNDITMLQVAQELRDYHHNALWEEEKHFTWFISIILSGTLIVITNDKISLQLKVLLGLLTSIIGEVICLIALRVVRNESNNFQNALIRLNHCLDRCFDDFGVPNPPTTANKSYLALLGAALRGRCSIRDAFQLVFVAFAFVFALLIVGIVYVAFTRRVVF